MPAPPLPHSWTSGDTVTETGLDATETAILFLRAHPYAQLTRTSDQSIPDSTTTAMLWTTEVSDSHNGHSTSSNTSRYVAPYDGLYLCTASIPFLPNATGLRQVNFRVNGTTTYTGARDVANGSVTAVYAATRLISLSTGDYVEVTVWQNSGGALSTDFSGSTGNVFDIVWMSA